MNKDYLQEILEDAKEFEAGVQPRSEKRIKELRKELHQVEEEFDSAREQWRNDRRALVMEIEQLEEAVDHAVETARKQLSEDLHSELRFQIEELSRAREQAEQDLASARQRYEADRNNLKAQIAAMQGSFIDAVQRSNNPARQAVNARDQLDAKLAEARQEWQLEWSAERRRLLGEIERLKNTGSPVDDKREAARRAVLEKLGKVPAPAPRSTFSSAHADTTEWESEREQLNLKIKRLEADLEQAQDAVRSEIGNNVRAEFDIKLADANRDRQRLEEEIQSVTGELAGERQRLTERIKSLEDALPDAQEAARKQVAAELETQFTAKLDEAARMRSRIERKHQDSVEEYEDQLRSSKKRIFLLEEALREAKEGPAGGTTSD